MKRNQLTPVIEANNIEDFIQLIIVAASLRRDARLNDFLREEADIARVTWAKTEPAFVRNILNLIRKADNPQAVILEGGTDADDPSGTVGVARGTRGSSASDIPRRF